MIESAIRKLRAGRALVRHEGVARTALLAMAEFVWFLRLMRGGYVMALAPGACKPGDRALPAPLTGPRDLPPAEIRRLVWPRDWWGTPEFVEACVARGERCMAVSDGDGLAGFQWYAEGRTRQFGAWWQPAPGYRLTHAHWVAPAWRRLGVNPALTAASVRTYCGPTTLGLLCTVEIANLTAVRSLRRSGYRPLGFVIQIGPECLGIGFGYTRGNVLRKMSGAPRQLRSP